MVREDVIEVLRQAGVDNIQYFDAVLQDPSTGKSTAITRPTTLSAWLLAPTCNGPN